MYRRSIQRLDQLHLCCLCKIAGIKWRDRVTNTEVLQICGTTCIEVFLLKGQLRWVGHVMRMPENRIPKQVFLDNWHQASGHSVDPSDVIKIL